MADLVRSRPLFVFDGHCVLCSTGVRTLMRLDRAGKVQFLSAQSDLGQAIYRHLGRPLDDSYLLIDSKGTHTKSNGYFRLATILGGAWRLAGALRIVPGGLRDRLYDIVARNRYSWFGTSEHCALLSPEQRARLVVDDPELRAQLKSSQ